MQLALENRHVGPARPATVAELLERGLLRFGHWRGRSAALTADDPLTLLEALAAAADVGIELTVAPPDAPAAEALVDVVAEERRGALTEHAGARSGTAVEPGVLLFTSGSTGAPKPVRHPFERLQTFADVRAEPHRWLVTYVPGTYAWMQTAMLGLAVPGQGLVFPASLGTGDVLTALREHGVTAVSSTPTFWRFLLATAPREALAGLGLRQLTLGGERVDQPILDRLAAAFPEARLTHIFASAETGPALVVSDGRAGFPASYLDRPLLGGRVRLRIRDGTLRVRSAYGEGGGERWIDTGDVAELAGDRVHIRGRREHDTINVGGAKVSRGELEDFVRGLDGVAWARAYAARSPIAGGLVGLEVVVDRDRWAADEDAERAITVACGERFPEHYLPRVIRFLDEVPLGAALKTRV